MSAAAENIEASPWRLLEALPNPYLVVRPDAPRFTIAAVNEAYLRATMTQREEIVGRALFDVFPDDPADAEATGVRALQASLERVLASGAPDRMVVQKYDVRRPDGGFEERYWNPINSPIVDGSGRVEHIVHHVEDVTDLVLLHERSSTSRTEAAEARARADLMQTEILRQSAEVARANRELRAANETLTEREEHLRATIELNPQIPWTADPDGRVTGFNQRWLDVTGLTRDEALGEGWARVPHPDDRPRMSAAWQRAISTGEPYDVESRLRMAEGGYRWWRTRAFPRRGADGHVLRWYGTTEDIHDRREAEATLRAEQERLRLIFESATDYAIFTMDLNRQVTSWNEGARRLLGWALDEIVGQSGDMIFLPEDREAGAPAWEATTALERGRATNERWHQRKDGSPFWASGLVMPLRDLEAGPDAPPLGLLKILRDTTERKRGEERRRLLVDELNHRVKNMLAMVQSLALQTVRGSPDPQVFSVAFQKRIVALARAHDLLTREHWEGVALHKVVRAAVGFLSGGSRVSVSGCASSMVLPPGAVVTLTLALHELATNAAAHGALSVPEGMVSVDCSDTADGEGAVVEWLERDGPIIAGPPVRWGFGLRLLGRGIMGAAGMAAEVHFEPDGVRCVVSLRPRNAASHKATG